MYTRYGSCRRRSCPSDQRGDARLHRQQFRTLAKVQDTFKVRSQKDALLLDSRLSSLCGPAMTACCERWRRWFDPLSVLTRPRCRDTSPDQCCRGGPVSRCYTGRDTDGLGVGFGCCSTIPCQSCASPDVGDLDKQARLQWLVKVYKTPVVRPPVQGCDTDAAHRTAVGLPAVGGTLSAGALLMPLLLCLLVQFFPAMPIVRCQQVVLAPLTGCI
jgi:hypothetical protein